MFDAPLTQELPASVQRGGLPSQAAAYRPHKLAGYAALDQMLVRNLFEVHRELRCMRDVWGSGAEAGRSNMMSLSSIHSSLAAPSSLTPPPMEARCSNTETLCEVEKIIRNLKMAPRALIKCALAIINYIKRLNIDSLKQI